MIDRKALLDDLQKLLPKLEADLLERSESAEVPEVGRKLREEYAAAQAANRTAQSFEEWRSDLITQVAAAWVLTGVFVRFLEDNGLVGTPKLAGPSDRLKRARDEHEVYFRAHPTLTDRDYLLSVFDGLKKHAATKEVFGPHNPIRDLASWLSGDTAGELIAFFQRIDPSTGDLVHDFTDPAWDTRFLGDLYQDLSEAARKKYALLQTPVFVEEFILDRTLDPAIEEFGLAKPGYKSRLEPDGRLHPDDRFRMIDPACGSGHFLLGSFARLLERWRKKEPGEKGAVLVQRALDGVHGVDANPYAIAIARFRLLLAALKESGVTRLGDAPGFVIHLGCGDSLLHGSVRMIQQTFDVADELKHVYQPEDPEALRRFLQPGNYHAVVANPPYITPKDRALNQAYRDRYRTCHMKYSLAVPFLERIVSLAMEDGFTGQITANSFMKREFGKKLIEEFFPQVDLTHVIDTSGAYIPGHGTPTVILFARNRKPVSRTLRTVMGIRGEPSPPDDPSKGLVWSSIEASVDLIGASDSFVSVGDSSRDLFLKHPWSVGGGGAAELKDLLDTTANRLLGQIAASIGPASFAGLDDAFVSSMRTWRRVSTPPSMIRPFAGGDQIRDWRLATAEECLTPYDQQGHSIKISYETAWTRRMWLLRKTLESVTSFNGKTRQELGEKWWTWYRWIHDRVEANHRIAFAFVATHNNFVLDRAKVAFNRSAPVIILKDDSNEEDYLRLLGLLNCSTACFWMKQVFMPKGGHGIGRGIQDETWEGRLEFDGTKLHQFPLPVRSPLTRPKQLDQLGRCKLELTLLSAKNAGAELRDALERMRVDVEKAAERMISIQEELDWECYHLYGIIDEDLTTEEALPLKPGQRAFEIVIARRSATGEINTSWFDRHNSTATTVIPDEWPDYYRRIVDRRVALISSDPRIALLEQPEYKRRWNTELWPDQLARALRSWLLELLESFFDFDGRMADEGKFTAKLPIGLISAGRLADAARQDATFLEVGAVYRNDPAFDVSRLVAELVEAESVPFLPALRYKPSGLRKRDEWEKTWELQRQEDEVDARTRLPKDHRDHLTEQVAKDVKKKQVGTIPVPPKYTSADFLNGDYWRLRGKLDVPKERWVSFPHCEGEDGTLMVAWAGYDHLQLARAISAYYVDVQERLGGREDPRLVPLLACLVELLPWLKQWHNQVDPEFGVPMGDYFEGFLQEESRNLGLTLEEINAWQPPQRASRGGGRGRRRANG